MNAIKNHKILSGLLFVACLFVTSASSAHWRHGWGWGGGIIIGPTFYSQPYYYSNCGWVGGHWRHGHWIPAHRVCWY